MAAPYAHHPPPVQAAPAAGRPLTPFEHLMLIDGRTGHPMCFFLENRISGPLQEDRFRKAVETAARRHPLLCSRVDLAGAHPVWLPPDVVPTVIWNPPTIGSDPWRDFDLRHESGVRIVVLESGARRYRVVLQFHHSTCDGVAGCEYMGDMWAAYAGIEPKPFSRPRTTRHPPSTETVAEQPRADGVRQALREAWAFARFRPTPLARASGGAAARNTSAGEASRCDPRSPPYAWIDFDHAAVERLRTAASAGGVSLNDSILAAAMRAAVAWNTCARRRPGNVRVTMPVNLRPPGQREPARNDLGYAFLDRTAAECADIRKLETSIATATRWIVEHGAAAFFLDALALLARRPWLLRLVSRMPVCISTVVVSNVGDPSRRMRSGVPRVDGHDAPADLVIEGCFGVPPLRPRTRAAIGVTTYAGSLSLCCLCSAHPDPQEGGRQFLELIRQQLDAMASAGVA